MALKKFFIQIVFITCFLLVYFKPLTACTRAEFEQNMRALLGIKEEQKFNEIISFFKSISIEYFGIVLRRNEMNSFADDLEELSNSHHYIFPFLLSGIGHFIENPQGLYECLKVLPGFERSAEDDERLNWGTFLNILFNFLDTNLVHELTAFTNVHDFTEQLILTFEPYPIELGVLLHTNGEALMACINSLLPIRKLEQERDRFGDKEKQLRERLSRLEFGSKEREEVYQNWSKIQREWGEFVLTLDKAKPSKINALRVIINVLGEHIGLL